MTVTIAGPQIELGAGALERVGPRIAALGWRDALLVADDAVRDAGIAQAAERSLTAAAVSVHPLTVPPGEPTDEMVCAAIAALAGTGFDGVCAVGGGSVLDMGKLIALLLGAGGRLEDYVNPPFGRGAAPSAPLPVVAVPTTAGSGSDVSAVAVVDLVADGVKTAVSNAALRPRLAVADPLVTLSVPPGPTAAAGLDVLAHALESLTARPHDDPTRASASAVYAGANPYSDALCERALELLRRSLPRAVAVGDDVDARTDVMLAATLANLGAAVAGSHLGHAIAYAIAGHRRSTAAARRVPHGVAAALALPGLVAETYSLAPERHERFAGLLGAGDDDPPGPRRLARAVRRLLTRCGVNDLNAYGFTIDDGKALASKAMSQERLVANAPRSLDGAAAERIVSTAFASKTMPE